MNFEEYNERLQEIVKILEKNDVSIEEGTKLYEEGVEIAKKCYEILNKNKGKITILKDELDNLINNDENI
ncbi:MAG: exodeoxyribonuclease VII small subunit [Clostridiales bacterium]|nr:exodeoxyribonuclease VII small subunit [Clostridiales bacterium]MBR4003721.1 exodeoxyribonuclease VII small subunit [Clostridia bacterium]